MKVVYAGMFDPLTLGHLDVMQRASCLFEEVIIAVANNSLKAPLFSLEQRVSFIRKALTQVNCRVLSFEGLLVDFMKKHAVTTLLRSLRSPADYDYEARIFYANKQLLPELELIFLPASDKFQAISSTFVRDVIRYGGDLQKFVPFSVLETLSA